MFVNDKNESAVYNNKYIHYTTVTFRMFVLAVCDEHGCIYFMVIFVELFTLNNYFPSLKCYTKVYQ